MDNKKTTAIVLAIIAVIIIGLGFYFSGRSNEGDLAVDGNTNTPVDTTNYYQSVNVKHQYKDGKHTYAGEISLPTPCTALANTVKNDAAKKSFEIAFTTTSTSEMCAQVITSRAFKVTFEGPANATVKATLNGKDLRFNIFEVGANQDLDSFKIDIKA